MEYFFSPRAFDFFLFVFLLKLTVTLEKEKFSYWIFKGSCKGAECQRALASNKGIFCANFYNLQERLPACKSRWCVNATPH